MRNPVRMLTLNVTFAIAIAGAVLGQASPALSPQSLRPDTTSPTRPVRGYTGFGKTAKITTAYDKDGKLHVTGVGPQIVYSIAPGSPAEIAGLVVGDTLVEINGVDAAEDKWPLPVPGVKFVLRIRRGDAEREIIIMPIAPRAHPDSLRQP